MDGFVNFFATGCFKATRSALVLDLRRLGQNIRFQRQGRGWSLANLEEHSGVPKAYISDLENATGGKPNVQYLYQVATALGTTIDFLINERGADPEPSDRAESLPPGLAEFAAEAQLSEEEKYMLGRLNFRGNRPRDKDSWRAIYEVIKLASKQSRS
jgi:transcriptional regulator with XRE-family HTH domain